MNRNRNDGWGRLSRREFTRIAGCAAGGVSLARVVEAAIDEDAIMEPFRRYADLLKTLENRGQEYRVLGYAPDRSPVVAVRGGGKKEPAIFIGAGSHSTEHAGVVAAVELIDRLETDHQVYVIPCRDPIGLNGYAYALSLSLGEVPDVQSVGEVEALLREKGEVLYDEDETLLALIGERGYSNRGLYRRFEKGAAFLEPLKGRRIYFPSRSTEMPGAAPLERAYTLVATPEGEILHLNRFHDTPWAPVEVRCTRRLMAEVQPRLVFDLHEYGGDAFWLSARHQRTDEDEAWELRMAEAAAGAAVGSGARIAPEGYSPGSFFRKIRRGAYWLEPQERGEGLNLADFAAARFGPGFTIETGMKQPFEHRVRLHMLVVQAAVRTFEQRYA
jgi:hypothetical protein